MIIVCIMYVVGIWLLLVAGWILNAYPDGMDDDDYGES